MCRFLKFFVLKSLELYCTIQSNWLLHSQILLMLSFIKTNLSITVMRPNRNKFVRREPTLSLFLLFFCHTIFSSKFEIHAMRYRNTSEFLKLKRFLMLEFVGDAGDNSVRLRNDCGHWDCQPSLWRSASEWFKKFQVSDFHCLAGCNSKPQHVLLAYCSIA